MHLLHITAHMGGGVGRAITEVATHNPKSVESTIFCLEKPQNTYFIRQCQNKGVSVKWELSGHEARIQIQNSDVIIINWWHHPKMIEFLVKYSFEKKRIVLWCHINGCSYPWLSYSFLNMHNTIFMTSQYCFDNPIWTAWQREEIQRKSFLVYGLGDLKDIPVNKHISHTDIKVGYIGTLAESKLHPDYVLACKKIITKYPSIKFQLYGELSNASWLTSEITKHQLSDYFEFMGYSQDVVLTLRNFDIFGYPLTPRHYGTTENAILEAMAAGIPVVLLKQNTEQYIVQHEYNGFLANDIDEYTMWVVRLAQDQSKRQQIGNEARESVLTNYDLNKNLERFYNGILYASNHPSKRYDYKDYFGLSSEQWILRGMPDRLKEDFLSSIADAREGRFMRLHSFTYRNPIIRDNSKSSVHHFARYFSDNLILNEWSKYITKAEKICNRL